MKENSLAFVKRKCVILQHDNARAHSARKTLHKIKEFGWEVISHTLFYRLPSGILFVLVVAIFLEWKQMQKKSNIEFLLIKNHLCTIDPSLKICGLDGKISFIMRVITS